MRYLNSNPQIMGGRLVVKGTRTPIGVLLQYLKAGYSMAEIKDFFPWITMRNLKGAIGEIIDMLSHQPHAQKIL